MGVARMAHYVLMHCFYNMRSAVGCKYDRLPFKRQHKQHKLAWCRYFSHPRPVLTALAGANAANSFPQGSTITVTAQLTALTSGARAPRAQSAGTETREPDIAMCSCAGHAV